MRCDALGHYYADRSGGFGWPSCVLCGKPASLQEHAATRPCCDTPENTAHAAWCLSVAARTQQQTQPKGTTMPESISAAELRAQAAALISEAAAIDQAAAKAAQEARDARKPKMPTVTAEEPAYVAFARYQAGRNYHYAAVGWRDGRNVRWMVTGATTNRFNWPGLLQWIGEANWPTLCPLTPGEPMVAPGDEPPVAEEMGNYGRVARTVTYPQ